MQPKKTIVVVATWQQWVKAKRARLYLHSTIDKRLQEVGFIHCTFPHQTMEIVSRRNDKQEDLVLLLIDPDKVKAEVKYEPAFSGRPGTFPHIYGPLNTDAVYKVVELRKDATGMYVQPADLPV
ncbi:DUF952 domain-containing protein [Candidatus Microgenomates bacterium]|nr:DUF952 domain-containing protein [Candidatus Microgenomates bacterium]